MSKYEKGIEGKELKWGKEYWMKDCEFNKDTGVCKILYSQVPPTVLLHTDGSYEYSGRQR